MCQLVLVFLLSLKLHRQILVIELNKMKLLGFLLLTSLFNFGVSYSPNSFNDLDQTNYSQQLSQTGNSSTGNSSSATPTMLQLSPDSEFHFEILRDLGLGVYSGADIGEVLTAAVQIVPGNFESYSTAFNRLANRVYAKAQNIDACRYPVSAREAMFRASTYFRSADFFLHGNWSDPRINSLWVQWIAAFNTALSLLPVPGKRVTLKGDGFDIPAIWYTPDISVKRRPTILICNGYDGSQEELYHSMGKAALERGYNVITFEGPGQPTVRRQQNLGFIPDWEKVVSPVVDYLATLPEVDMSALGLVGYSLGGYLAPRAAAFEHRLAAVIALDGIYDFGENLLSQFGTQATALFKSGNQTEFDSVINAFRVSPNATSEIRWTLDQGLWSFYTMSPWNWVNQSLAYTLKNVVNQITVPVFVGDAQDDLFFIGQAKMLAVALGNRSTYYEFLDVDGAGEHAAAGASIMQNQVALDWFQNVTRN